MTVFEKPILDDGAWPATRGDFQIVADPGPVVGVNWTTTVAGEVWRIVTISAAFATSAVVATRRVNVALSANARVYMGISSNNQTQAASIARRYVFSVLYPKVGLHLNAGRLIAPLTDLFIYPASTVALEVENLQGNDTWTTVSVVYHRWRI